MMRGKSKQEIMLINQAVTMDLGSYIIQTEITYALQRVYLLSKIN